MPTAYSARRDRATIKRVRKQSLPEIVKVLKEKSWSYGALLVPHDGAHHELTSGETPVTLLTRHGFTCYTMPRTDEVSQIASVRMLIPRCILSPTACKRGLDCLKAYHNEYNPGTQAWKPRAKHDWSSHGAKAFATLAYFAPQLARGVKGGAYARPAEDVPDHHASLGAARGLGWMR